MGHIELYYLYYKKIENGENIWYKNTRNTNCLYCFILSRGLPLLRASIGIPLIVYPVRFVCILFETKYQPGIV